MIRKRQLRRWTPEGVYTGIMALCLVCCAVMLGSVLTGRPLAVRREVHVPVLRETGAPVQPWRPDGGGASEETGEETLSHTGGGCVLTAEYLEAALSRALPETLACADVRVELADPKLRVGLSVRREELRRYLEECGGRLSLRQSLGLRLLPRTLETEADFSVRADGDGLHLSPCALRLGGKEVSLTGLPEKAFAVFDQAVETLLRDSGTEFETCRFTDEGLLLE